MTEKRAKKPGLDAFIVVRLTTSMKEQIVARAESFGMDASGLARQYLDAGLKAAP